MTNPLSNLSKYPRRPFRDKSFNPLNEKLTSISNYEIPNFGDLNDTFSDSEFNDLLDDVTANMATKNLSKYSNYALQLKKSERSSFNNEYETSPCQPLSKDFDIMSKMLERIKSLELSKRYQDKEIRDKNLRIKVLEDKCNLYKTAQEVKDVNYDRLKEMENKCVQLENKILEMESFLADYGLIWVGDKSTVEGLDMESVDPMCHNPSDSSNLGTSRCFVVDYDKIFKNIDELNFMMNSEEALLTMTAPQRVELKKREAVPITFYSNGISVYSGPFRPFSEESTRQVINDFHDGYFPSELEDRFPSGVPIAAIDRRNIMYDAKQVNAFQGVGRTLGGQSTMSKLTWQRSADRDNKQYDQPYTGVLRSDAGTQLTMEQFLCKLPENRVTKDGKVIAIRNAVREAIENKAAMASPGTQGRHKDDDRSLSSPGDVAKIKIRSLSGDRVYHISIHRKSLIGDLYQKMFEASGLSHDSHVLVLSYPTRRRLTDLSLTIEGCSLMPTASLHIEASSSAGRG